MSNAIPNRELLAPQEANAVANVATRPLGHRSLGEGGSASQKKEMKK